MGTDNNSPDRRYLTDVILETIAISGELPSTQVSRFSGGDRYKRKILDRFKEKNLIYSYYRDALRGYRLTSKAKSLLLSRNPERFTFYLTGQSDTNNPKSEITRRLRLHRIAETYMTMQNAGVSIFRDDKPDVFYSEEFVPSLSLEIQSPVFYSSRELKEIGMEFVSIRGARAVGVLLTPTEVFVVYNTGHSLLKWDYKPEMRTRALLKNVLCQQRLSRQYQPESVRALMLGDSMEIAYQLMTSTGGVKFSYFTLDGNYDSFAFLTNDRKGELLLRLLCDRTLTNQLDDMLSEGLYEADPALPVENDAITENDEPVLFGYSLDMPRIRRFDTALRLQNRTGILICFDYQEEILKRYCSKNVRFQTIDFTKFEGRFFS